MKQQFDDENETNEKHSIPPEEQVSQVNEEHNSVDSCEQENDSATKDQVNTSSKQQNEQGGQAEISLQEFLSKTEEQLKLNKEKISALEERLLKLQAEYENYRKRTTKEKEELEDRVINQTCQKWLPVVDNLERAILAPQSFKNVDEALAGINLIFKQTETILQKLKLEKIAGLGATFNPNLHEAIMHIESDEFGEQEIVEVFENGYTRDNQIVRLSVVKVAN